MSSPAVVLVKTSTSWPQGHGTRTFKYGTLLLVSTGTSILLCEKKLSLNLVITLNLERPRSVRDNEVTFSW